MLDSLIYLTDSPAMVDVTLCECFARDGLQHEPAFVATDRKRALIERERAANVL